MKKIHVTYKSSVKRYQPSFFWKVMQLMFVFRYRNIVIA